MTTALSEEVESIIENALSRKKDEINVCTDGDFYRGTNLGMILKKLEKGEFKSARVTLCGGSEAFAPPGCTYFTEDFAVASKYAKIYSDKKILDLNGREIDISDSVLQTGLIISTNCSSPKIECYEESYSKFLIPPFPISELSDLTRSAIIDGLKIKEKEYPNLYSLICPASLIEVQPAEILQTYKTF